MVDAGLGKATVKDQLAWAKDRMKNGKTESNSMIKPENVEAPKAAPAPKAPTVEAPVKDINKGTGKAVKNAAQSTFDFITSPITQTNKLTNKAGGK